MKAIPEKLTRLIRAGRLSRNDFSLKARPDTPKSLLFASVTAVTAPWAAGAYLLLIEAMTLRNEEQDP